ncbi:MAG: prenyltransferase/squalene oxidase repeat-containing protein [Anaerolineales bacterium]
MQYWQENLTADPTPWLMEPGNPAIRFLALRDLFESPALDIEVQEAQKAIPEHPPFAALLSSQHPNGYWVKPDFYLPRTSLGTFWVLTVLGDMGLNRENDHIQRACDFMFAQQRENGAFCRRRRIPKQGILWDEDTPPCTQARIVRFLIQFGYGDDPRVKRAFAWLVGRQREDGMWHCRGEEGRGCLRATIDVLRAAALIPGMDSHAGIRRGAEAVVQLIMETRMSRYHVGEKWGTWESLKYPYFGFSLLSALDALGRLGWSAAEPRIRMGLDYLLSRQLPDGRWPLDEAWPEPPLDFGEPGKPNKWITLDVLRVLKRYIVS